MKNKKLFTKIMLCVCLCLPSAVTLSACKNDEHNISDKWSNNATYHWHKCLDDDCDYTTDKAEHIYDDDNDMTCNTCGYIRQEIQLYKNITISGVISDYTYVKQGENAHFELKLSDNYDPDTLKIMNGTTELTWTKADNLTAPTTFTDEDVAVGTLDIENVQGHLNLVATAEEATIDFEIKTNSSDISNKEELLSEFTLKDGKTLYGALTTEGYRYKLSVSEFKNKRIDFTSTYDSCIYNINDLNLNHRQETNYISVEKNNSNKSFSFILDNDTLNSKTINIEFGVLNYANIEIEKVSGKIGSVSIYYPEHEELNSSSSNITFNAKYEAQIRVTITENTNFDYTNLKVWLNKTEMLLHTADDSIENDTTYYYLDISKEKSPTYYAGTSAEKFEISFTGVTLKDDAEDVTIVRVDNETTTSISIDGNRLSWSASACYYFDKAEAKMYFIKETEKNNVLILNGCINKLSISANDTTYTIDLTELFKTENGVVGDYLSDNRHNISIDSKLNGICPFLELGNCNFKLTGIDTNEDGKFTIDEIINIQISLIDDLPENVTITILG